MHCELCRHDGGQVLYHDAQLRIILVADDDYPAFCRLIWQGHVKEMSDLDTAQREHLFHWLIRTEQALRTVLNPDKINLASFGNMVPHLHWHVIPRFSDDRHFPQPVWGAAQRDGVPHGEPAALALALTAALHGD